MFVDSLKLNASNPFLRRIENADIMCQMDQRLYAKDGHGFQVWNAVWKYRLLIYDLGKHLPDSYGISVALSPLMWSTLWVPWFHSPIHL